MAFDVAGARKAGYSDAEISGALARQFGFDLAGARSAGYSDGEVIAKLAGKASLPGQSTPAATKEPGMLEKAIGTGEAALMAGTGAIGGMAGMTVGALSGLGQAVGDVIDGKPWNPQTVEDKAAQFAHALTIMPQTRSGQDQAAAVGQFMSDVIVPGAAALPGLSGAVGSLAASMKGAAPLARAGAAAVLDRAATALPGRQRPAAEAQPAAAAMPVIRAEPAPPVVPAPRVEPVSTDPGPAAQGAGRPVPTLDQYVALRKLSAEPMSPEVRGDFLAWIKSKGGISFAEKFDITGETNGVRSNPAGIFRRGGAGPDDLAMQAAQEGYLRPDMAGDTGAFIELVQNAIRGERVLTMEQQGMKAARDGGDAAAQSRLRAAEDRARALGIDPAAAKGDAKVLESYLDRNEPALMAAAVDEYRGAQRQMPAEGEALAAKAKQIAEDVRDGGRTLAQFEAEVGPLSPVMRRRVAAELGEALPAEPVPVVEPAATAVASVRRPAPEQPTMVGAMSAEQLAQTARTAADGGIGAAKAEKALAEQAAPNRATVKAAQRLDIADHLQADHVTTNEGYRQIVAIIKSNPNSKIALAEREGLRRVAERATELVDEIGGTTNASALDATVKARLSDIQASLDKLGDKLYKQVRENIPAKAEAPADAALQFIAKQADDAKGLHNLSPIERMIAKKLMPDDAGPPTYALLDGVRRDVGDATKGKGHFKDANSGLARKLYALLSEDQAAVADKHGMLEVYDAARKTVAQRKAVEDDLVALFGRDLDRSIAASGDRSLPGAFAALAKGDSARLGRLLAAIPEDLRQHVVASGLATMFRKMGTRGELDFTGFAKWYEGLKRNRQAYSAVMSNLPLTARKQIEALYRVSAGVSESLNRRVTTGRLATVKAEMMGADTLMESLFSVAKRSGAGLATEAITTPLGMPGAGLAGAIGSALTKGKPRALTAIDDLLASPEFEQLARAEPGKPQEAAARRVAMSAAFSRFAREVGNPAELRNREGWILQSMRPVPQQQPTDRRQPVH